VSLYYFTDIPAPHARSQRECANGWRRRRAQAQALHTHCAYATGTRLPTRRRRESLPETGPRSPGATTQLQAKLKNLTSQTTKLASRFKSAQDDKTKSDTDYTRPNRSKYESQDPTKTIELKQRQPNRPPLRPSQPGPVGLRRRQVPTGRYAEPARQFAKSERQLAREAGYGAAGAQRRANLRFPGTPENASGGAIGVRCRCVRPDNTPYLYARHGRPASDPAKRLFSMRSTTAKPFLCAASPTICSP